MAGTLTQSTILPHKIINKNYGQIKGSKRSRRTVKMIGNAHAHYFPMQSFYVLRQVTSIDNIACPRKEFHVTVAAVIYLPRTKGNAIPEKAIKVIMLAQEEARHLGHNFVGTKQILLGLTGEGIGIATKVLKSMGINLKEAWVEVEKVIGRGRRFVVVEISFTPREKRALELSLEEAKQLGWFLAL